MKPRINNTVDWEDKLSLYEKEEFKSLRANIKDRLYQLRRNRQEYDKLKKVSKILN